MNHRSISVVSPLAAQIVKSAACGPSPEGQLLSIVKILSGVMGTEIIYVPPVSKGSAIAFYFTPTFRRASGGCRFLNVHEYLAQDDLLQWYRYSCPAYHLSSRNSHWNPTTVLLISWTDFLPKNDSFISWESKKPTESTWFMTPSYSVAIVGTSIHFRQLSCRILSISHEWRNKFLQQRLSSCTNFSPKSTMRQKLFLDRLITAAREK